MKTFLEFINEGYEIYHNSFTLAIQAAEKVATDAGYTVDKEEWAQEIGLGKPKPSKGDTNKYSLSLFKNDKEQKKKLHIQVYNRGTTSNEFELNCYIS